MSTVADIITQAFLDLNAIATGETITTAEQTDAFTRLNQMLSSWSTEQATIYTVVHQTFSLTANTSAYTLGTTGSLVTTARPVKITGAAGLSGTFRTPIDVISFDEFSATTRDGQGLTSTLPAKLAADNQFPNLNVKVWPTPNASPGSLVLDFWTVLTAFSAVSDVVNLPEGYEDALHFNLALRLYPQYAARGANPDPILPVLAKQSKEAIVLKNAGILGLQPAPQAPAPPQQ